MMKKSSNRDLIAEGEHWRTARPAWTRGLIASYLADHDRYNTSNYEDLSGLHSADEVQAPMLASLLRLHILALAVGTPHQKAETAKVASEELNRAPAVAANTALRLLIAQIDLSSTDESKLSQFLRSHLDSEHLRSLSSDIDGLKGKQGSLNSSDRKLLRLLELLFSSRLRGEFRRAPENKLLSAA